MRDSTIAISFMLLLLACEKSEKKRTRSEDEPARSAVASNSAVALAPRGEPPAGWSLLQPAGGGYSVFLPGVAEKLDGALSELWAVKRPSGSAFMATCSTSKQPEETFKGMRRGKIGERKLISAAPIADGRKGERLAIELDTDKGKLISNELLLVGDDRVCSFSALVPASADEKADVDRFFDSARLAD